MSNKTRGTLALLAAGALTLTMAPQAFAGVKDDADGAFGVTYNKPGLHRFAERDRIATAVSASQSRTWGWEKTVRQGQLYWECTTPADLDGPGKIAHSKIQGRELTNREARQYSAGDEKVVSYQVGRETRHFTCTATVAREAKKIQGVDIIIARSDDYADALAATPLADVLDAPVLVNPTAKLDPRVENEIARLARGTELVTVHLLGGTNALSHDVENAIDDIRGVDFTLRYQGIDRYETATQLAWTTVEWYGIDSGADLRNVNVYLTTGVNFPDALAAGAAAAHNDGVVLLTNGDDLDRRGFTDQFLIDLNNWVADDGECAVNPSTPNPNGYQWAPCWLDANTWEVFAVGGPSYRAAVDNDIRLADSYVGSDRYETAVLTARETFDQVKNDDAVDVKNYAVVSGQTYADALVASAYIANADGPLLLTHPDRLTPVTQEYLEEAVDWNDRVFTFGGTGAMQLSVHEAIEDLFKL